MGRKTVSRYEDRILATSKRAARDLMGESGFERRAAEISSLPKVEWKGRTLYTLRCHGTRGRGPHDVNVPESLLWQLIGLDGYRCTFHAGD